MNRSLDEIINKRTISWKSSRKMYSGDKNSNKDPLRKIINKSSSNVREDLRYKLTHKQDIYKYRGIDDDKYRSNYKSSISPRMCENHFKRPRSPEDDYKQEIYKHRRIDDERSIKFERSDKYRSNYRSSISHEDDQKYSATSRTCSRKRNELKRSADVHPFDKHNEQHNKHNEKPSQLCQTPVELSAEKSSSSGYRVAVYNLPINLTESQLKEQFEDVGEITKSRIIRPSAAEVFYRSLSDAEDAVDAFHNIQWDGQEVNCFLTHTRDFKRATTPSICLPVRGYNSYSQLFGTHLD